MISLRLVLDTNVIVSAAIFPAGMQHSVFLPAITKPARLYVSHEILQEYAGVLAQPRFRILKLSRLQLLQTIQNESQLIVPKRRLAVAVDPDDDKFIECAERARADYLITGNTRDFPERWRNTKIVNSRDFMTIVAPHLVR
jgi:putative PIN family toxin of toxin-antitoxin system